MTVLRWTEPGWTARLTRYWRFPMPDHEATKSLVRGINESVNIAFAEYLDQHDIDFYIRFDEGQESFNLLAAPRRPVNDRCYAARDATLEINEVLDDPNRLAEVLDGLIKELTSETYHQASHSQLSSGE